MSIRNQPLSTSKLRLFWSLLTLAILLSLVRFGHIRIFGLSFESKDGTNAVVQVDESARKEALRFSMYRVLFDLGIRTDWLSGSEYHKTVRIPADLPSDMAFAELVSTFRDLGGTLLKAEASTRGDKKTIVVGYAGEKLFEMTLIEDQSLARVSGKIAIVIDDFGYSFKLRIQRFLDMNPHVNISILPGLKHTADVSQAAAERELNILLHMPMEPEKDEFPQYKYMLRSGMTEKEIRTRLRQAMKLVPQARGLNNHMGSLATTDRRLMQIVIKELKKSKYFFLDSMTNANSVGCAVAKQAGLPCGKNDLFLDAIAEEPFIRSQVNRLAELAARHGKAIGIGHPEQLTLDVLESEMPRLEKKGFEFVTVAELVKQVK